MGTVRQKKQDLCVMTGISYRDKRQSLWKDKTEQVTGLGKTAANLL